MIEGSRYCPGCGVRLLAHPGRGVIQCSTCGHRWDAQFPRGPAAPKPKRRPDRPLPEVRTKDLRDVYQDRVRRISDQLFHDVRQGLKCPRRWHHARIREEARRRAEQDVQRMINREAEKRVYFRDAAR